MRIKLSKLVCIGFALLLFLISAGISAGELVITHIGDKTIGENEHLTFNVAAGDDENINATITFKVENLPEGATFNPHPQNPNTYTFSLTPGDGTAGRYQVTFVATISGVGNDSDSIETETIMIIVEKVDKTNLLDAIEDATEKLEGAVPGNDIDQYPQPAIDTFRRAIATAQAVADSTRSTQTQVDNAISSLGTAEAAFDAARIKSIDKSSLKTAIAQANAKVVTAASGNGGGQYPQAAIDTFKAAIAVAQGVADDSNATNAEVSQAVTALKAAEAAFDAAEIPSVDKSSLVSAISAASSKAGNAVAGIEPGQYPRSAINAFNDAISRAGSVADDRGATQSEVNQAINELKEAEAVFDAAEIIYVDHTPPSTVSNLRESGSGPTWIRWTWTIPSDSDFSHVKVYLDGVFVRDTSNSFYNATGLVPGTVHAISIETVDASGNINPSLVSDSATSEVPIDIVPPSSVTHLNESSVGLDWIRWTWTNPNDADFQHVMVYFDGDFVTNTSDVFYNAIGLTEGTTHTIMIKTVDTSGNINPRTVSDSATTKITDKTPPGTVTNIEENNVGPSWINWTWINPNDPDFSNLRIYIDGIFVTNTPDSYYNATGLSNGIEHTISIETVDTSGNINSTWVSDQATTLKLPVILKVEGKNIMTSSITLEWDASDDTATVQITQDGLVLVNITESTYMHSDLNSSTTYNYILVPFNENGLQGEAVSISLTTSSTSSSGGGSSRGGSSSSRGGSSSSSGSSSSGGGGGAGSVEDFENVALKDVDNAYVRMNENVTYKFSRAGNDIQSVSFYSLKNSGEITSTIEILNNRSKLVQIDPEGPVYKYVNIWVGKAGFATSDNIRDARVEFRVNNSWMEEMGVNPEDVKLQRYNGTIWEVLSTNPKNSTMEYTTFEAQTPGFSPFVITSTVPLTSPLYSDMDTAVTKFDDLVMEKIQPEKSRIWTFIIVFILIGILAVGYEYLKKE